LPLNSFGLRLGLTLGLCGVPLGISPALAAADRVDTGAGPAGKSTRTPVPAAARARAAAPAVNATNAPVTAPTPASPPAPPGASPLPGPMPDPNTERILAEARVHFEAGTDHYAAGRYEEAIRRFQAGYALVPRPNFLVNIGQAYRKLGSADYMGGDFVGIFLASLDDAEPADLLAAPVRYSDGRNNNWQNPPAETRHL